MLLCGLRLPLWITLVGRFSRYVTARTVTRPLPGRYMIRYDRYITVTPTQALDILGFGSA